MEQMRSRSAAAQMTELAVSLRLARRLDEAIILEKEALHLKRDHLPAGHGQTLKSLENLAACCDLADRKPEAEALRRELAELRARAGVKQSDKP